MSTVHAVLPDGVDDPLRPSGGNAYDRRICAGLTALGWSVREHCVAGSWPAPDAAACAALTTVLAGLPDGAVVLLDGLIASAVPAVLVPEANRLRLVVLVHLPLGDRPDDESARAREATALSVAAAVITTSAWTRRRLFELYALDPTMVHVAEPGVDIAGIAPGTSSGGNLLCVAAVSRHKGHDLLLDALATITERRWRCVFAGTLERDPDFVDALRRQVDHDRIGDRVHFAGALSGVDLDLAYAAADVLVLASRGETYGMVVTEALARGLPVIATEVGGLPATLGRAGDGSRPGLLVAPENPAALATALRCWFEDDGRRTRLRHLARERRLTLSSWSATAAQISRVLVAASVAIDRREVHA